MFQSTPLREGRPTAPMFLSPARRVSIHAPTRGATCQTAPIPGKYGVSIHAPTRGATTSHWNTWAITTFQSTPQREGRQRLLIRKSVFKSFQSTPLREGDVKKLRRNIQPIHAPTRGRLGPPPHTSIPGQLQSTRLYARGDRIHTSSSALLNFNPRPYARGDQAK